SITALNRSTKELAVSGIDPVNRTVTPQVEIGVEATGGGLFSDPFAFNVVQAFGGTQVDVENQTGPAAPKLLLGRTIENPAGPTHLATAGGDIVTDSLGALVRTNRLDLEAPQGSLGATAGGTNTNRLFVQLVQSADRPTHLGATAAGDVVLNLQGR